MRLKNFKKSVLKNAPIVDVLSKLSFVVAGVFALIQFEESKRLARVERTFNYITNYEQGPASRSRNKIRNVLRPYAHVFSENEVNAEEYERLVMALIDAEQESRLSESIDEVVDFYEGLNLCLKQKLCEKAVIKKYFGDGGKIHFIWSQFYPYVLDRRKNNSQYANSLEWLYNKYN